MPHRVTAIAGEPETVPAGEPGAVRAFSRTVRVGTADTGYKTRAVVTVSIDWNGERLSITGETRRPRAADCDACGQIVETVRDMAAGELEITELERETLVSLWNRYHLNDLQAGCAHQRELGFHVRREHGDTARALSYALERLAGLETAQPARNGCLHCRGLADVGAPCGSCGGGMAGPDSWRAMETRGELERLLAGELRDDVGRACPVCGYRFGSEWKTEPVPVWALQYLFLAPFGEPAGETTTRTEG